jgi:predicted dehydrogenase
LAATGRSNAIGQLLDVRVGHANMKVIEAIGRRLRLGVVGGGPGSVIGDVNRAGARLDGYYDIVAAALSSDPERSRQTGRAIGVSAERAYPSWRELVKSEVKRKDRIDVIAVMTPNDSPVDPGESADS